jgi:tRNA pseudouridine38-40 synthase
MTLQRYFLEVFYKGSNYSGFQIQQNANSVQAEIEKAFSILQKGSVQLTGSSRTDAGVHALQNYFHFDYSGELHPHFVYKLNAILPDDIGIKKVSRVDMEAHCRFDAQSREYRYYVYRNKNPFLKDRAYYFPYKLDMALLKEAAAMIMEFHDFSAFSKRRSQVKSFLCTIEESEWIIEQDAMVYHIKANRFLRGMVRGITGTMLQLGRGKSSLNDFKEIILSKDCTKANFSVPAHALFLMKVNYPNGVLRDEK